MYEEIYNKILENLINSKVNEKHISELLTGLYDRIKEYDYESAYGYELYESNEYSNVFDDNGNWSFKPYSVAEKFSTMIDKNITSKLENEHSKTLMENLKLKTVAKFNDRTFLSDILKNNEVLEKHLKNKNYILNFVNNYKDVIVDRFYGTHLEYEKFNIDTEILEKDKKRIEDSILTYQNKKNNCQRQKNILDNKFVYKIPFVKLFSKEYKNLKTNLKFYDNKLENAKGYLNKSIENLKKRYLESKEYEKENNLERYKKVDFNKYDEFFNIYHIYEEYDIAIDCKKIERVFTKLEDKIDKNSDKCNYVKQLIKEIDTYYNNAMGECEKIAEYEEMEM